MMFIGEKLILLIVLMCWTTKSSCQRRYPREKMLQLREEVRAMFQHAYEGYLNYASDYDELRPLTCDGIDTWGSYSLTLIDALDTLATMGNFTEFRRVAELLEHKMNFDKDINVSVFETNIRIVGGLIGAHLMSKRAGIEVEEGWPCTGPLLRLAEDVARRLLPAFDTATGMPYGTVNLRYGVPEGETSITCTAGVGTFLIEFGTLSRLTGNPIYEQVALYALYSLWEHRSAIGLFGNHIDVQTGRWTALDAGIGAGVDSFYEYLVKAAILLNRPILLEMFHEARAAVDKYLKRDDWYVWASMHRGQVTLPVFQSLEAYWPGVLSMIGDFKNAIRTLAKYNSVWKQYGFLPEFYNILASEATANRESYPLRPELAESAMYLYRATNNKFLLEVGENMVRSIERHAKTACGYATIRSVLTNEKENRMESFFLAETTKYLYLLFDEDNFLHNIGENGEELQTPNGTCVVDSGAYIFNTEAHPVDKSALMCCQARHGDIFKDSEEEILAYAELQERLKKSKTETSNLDCSSSFLKRQIKQDANESKMSSGVEGKANESSVEKRTPGEESSVGSELTVYDLNTFFTFKREDFASAEDVLEYVIDFMKRFTLNSMQIDSLPIFEKNTSDYLGSLQGDYEGQPKTLWELYEMSSKYKANIKLMETLGVLSLQHDADLRLLDNILQALNTTKEDSEKIQPSGEIEEKIFNATNDYIKAFSNTTSMQEFLLSILKKGTGNKERSFTSLLTEEELSTLYSKSVAEKNIPSSLDLFERLHRVIMVKHRLIKAFQQLKSVVDERKKQLSATPTMPDDNNILPEKEKIFTKQSPNQQCQAPPKTKAEQPGNPLNSSGLDKKSESSSGDSIWSRLMQAILRTKKTTANRKFDEKLLLERTRASLRRYANIPQNYSVFTCPAQTFVDMAYSEFYP